MKISDFQHFRKCTKYGQAQSFRHFEDIEGFVFFLAGAPVFKKTPCFSGSKPEVVFEAGLRFDTENRSVSHCKSLFGARLSWNTAGSMGVRKLCTCQ